MLVILDSSTGITHVYRHLDTPTDEEAEELMTQEGFSQSNCQWMTCTKVEMHDGLTIANA